MPTKEKTALLWLLLPSLGALTLLSLWAVRSAGLTSLEGVVAWVRAAAPWSHLCFALLQLSSVIVAPIPSNVMATAGGVCFGFPTGFFLTFAAVTGGSLLTFSLARTLGRDRVQRMVERKVSERYLSLLQRKRDSFLVLVFLFPFFPDDILCILAGLTDIPFRRFALIVVLTRHWGLLVASLMGANLFTLPPWALPAMAAAGVALFAAGLRWGDALELRLLRVLAPEGGGRNAVLNRKARLPE